MAGFGHPPWLRTTTLVELGHQSGESHAGQDGLSSLKMLKRLPLNKLSLFILRWHLGCTLFGTTPLTRMLCRSIQQSRGETLPKEYLHAFLHLRSVACRSCSPVSSRL